MTRCLLLLAALVCAGCITQAETPPVVDQPPVVDADAGPIEDAGPAVDADLTDASPSDQHVPPDPDMGEVVDDAAPPPEPEAELRWRPAEVLTENRVALPLDILCVDAADFVPAAVIEAHGWRYQWRLVAQPVGARAAAVERFQDPRRPLDTSIPDDPSTTDACVFLPSAGAYLIELTVVDATVRASAITARVRVRATPDQAIHIELTWDTPGDRDQTDSAGADVDLHVRHPAARNWAQAPLDCYYANAAPEWGPVGPPGDPSLDIDDVNGSGPEHINLDEPEDTNAAGGLYRVGIDYYRADYFASGRTWGPSMATVRIFLDGELAFEAERLMGDTHHFWTVAGIEWIDGVGRVVPIDTYHD